MNLSGAEADADALADALAAGALADCAVFIDCLDAPFANKPFQINGNEYEYEDNRTDSIRIWTCHRKP